MITKMLISRKTDWFFYEDAKLDPFYFAMQILDKLSTRPKLGLKYKRIDLIYLMTSKRGKEALKTLDNSVVLLLSRCLIKIESSKDLGTTLYITDKGLDALAIYRREVKNANSQNKRKR
ncbi:hypothetical protein [Acetivibrio cellulolyticus]|uniref:hypothetical protein n=1 Tax=Acetivibrio cellulolyticus TaxID=35830 RepID=UPI0001E2E6B2|nr:hypothetical protein [Acetivibrio cellulolyticus]